MTGLCGLMLLGLAGGVPAFAQDAPAATPASPPAAADASSAAAPDTQKGDDQKKSDGPITTVTVVGTKPPVQNRIDRQVYDNSQNIDSASGTAADALNKVPSVNVDPDGNVTLRGNANVTVLMDGKPSAMLQGDNRAATLQSLSSGDIDSVEVMTNPGAQFGSDGTGGIINLVMKKNRKPGTSGALIANIGSQDRYNSALSIARNSGKMTLSGGLNVRHDNRNSNTSSVLNRLDPTTGDVVSGQSQTGKSQNTIDSASANAGINYNISDIDSVGAQINYARRQFDTDSVANYSLTGALPPGSLGDYTRTSTGKGPREDAGIDLNWNHTGDQPGETLKVDLRGSSSDGKTSSDNLNAYANGDNLVDTKLSKSKTQNGVFSVDYARNVGANGILTTGAQITYDDNHYVNVATGPDPLGDPATISSQLSSDFAYKQTLSAAYVTYQTTIGTKWTVMGGVRAEALDLTTHRIDAGVDSHIAYTKLSPSFFATYDLSDAGKIRFSYSHRLQRPQPQDLNPYTVYVDAQNVTQGNPNLRPQETDSYELGYEYTGKKINYQLRGYYQNNTDSITDYSYFLSDGVLLTTKRNFGTGQSSGLEFNLQGKLTPKLNVMLNGNLSQQELDTGTLAGKQSGTSLRGRVSLDYQVTKTDRVQFSYFSSGKTLTGQGYRSPFMMGNLSYRHNFTQKVAMVATVNDPFRTAKFKTITDNGTVFGSSSRSLQAPTFYIGLTYMLGGAGNDQSQTGGRHWGGGGGHGPGGPGGPGGPM
ncbi:outer membrane beta-barrel family protein [Asticcacaulis sp. EMRT-3]|uniref:outer membrane beta-barrel family protein n=1 Tax=Asticcacaulis sp. EMRT-3 TaxID=3040349 RepID=UPI0024AEB9D4|nr:outer membrane beta-barrel family protein [Asticcacaulis sp. EMRT-3]MDI7775099.1 outer membrane beta-barrel family protein [Asticcacaulis sp. EMRT-3]